MATGAARADRSNLSPTDVRERVQASLGAGITIERELGGGGMSRVYLAQDERLGRDMVVKVLEPDLAGQLSLERFEREIRVSASLQAPHIVPLIAAGHTADGLPYYTMPFINGESLRARLSRVGALPLREGIAIMRDVAKALAAAHAAGVVHRDIKPANILISSDTAVVTDFGIAKALANSQRGRTSDSGSDPNASALDTALTSIGTSVGTPAYSAPEQALGDPATDHRADLYSWGVVAYETLTGQPVFPGKTSHYALIMAHATEQPAPIAAALPHLPHAVANVIMRCLAKEPASRPGTAAELVSVLEASDAWTLTPTRRRLFDRKFEITEDVCRRMDRTALDPRLFGRSLEYVENDGGTEALLFFLHGTGQDAGDLTTLLESTPHHAIAATIFGFERAVDRPRVPVAIETHVGLLRELLREAVARVEPKRVIMIGISSGADVAFRLLGSDRGDGPRVDACLALGPNLSLATCFATRVFARLHFGDAAARLADLQAFAAEASSLDEWLNIMSYALGALRKFRDDLAPLSRFAQDIVRPFETNADAFADLYRAASERVRLVRCVFEESETCVGLVQELRMRNLDGGVLGPRYRPETLLLQPPADHFALFEPARVERHIEGILAALNA